MFSNLAKIKSLRLKAISLAEVLVVLAIAATTLVTISQLTVQMLVTIKNDELSDYTTGVSLQALEIIKSADNLAVTSPTSPTNPTPGGTTTIPDGSYKLNLDSNPPSIYWVASNTQDLGVTRTITECEASSPYYIPIDAEAVGGLSPLVCMQVIVTKSTNSLGAFYYKMQVVTVTKLGDKTKVDSILGYRKYATR